MFLLLKGYDGDVASYDGVGEQHSEVFVMLLMDMMMMLLVRMMLENKTLGKFCVCCWGV